MGFAIALCECFSGSIRVRIGIDCIVLEGVGVRSKMVCRGWMIMEFGLLISGLDM